jgi:hypothetical protein
LNPENDVTVYIVVAEADHDTIVRNMISGTSVSRKARPRLPKSSTSWKPFDAKALPSAAVGNNLPPAPATGPPFQQ